MVSRAATAVLVAFSIPRIAEPTFAELVYETGTWRGASSGDILGEARVGEMLKRLTCQRRTVLSEADTLFILFEGGFQRRC